MTRGQSPVVAAREVRTRTASTRALAIARVRLAHQHAELAHQRAAELHTKAAALFEKVGNPAKAAAERTMANEQREGAQTERTLKLSTVPPSKAAEAPAREGRHLLAVTQSFRFAEEAAAIGDFREALEWLQVVESIDDGLPPEWEQRRLAWQHERVR
jgi:hypothetical protein